MQEKCVIFFVSFQGHDPSILAYHKVTTFEEASYVILGSIDLILFIYSLGVNYIIICVNYYL